MNVPRFKNYNLSQYTKHQKAQAYNFFSDILIVTFYMKQSTLWIVEFLIS